MFYHLVALWIGFLLDKLLGDPSWLPHPIVAFGKVISLLDRKMNHGKHLILKGAVATLLLATVAFTLFYFLMRFSYQASFVLGIIVEAVFVFFGLAGTTLVKEGRAVYRELGKGIGQGREQVARIVGRDTQLLSENEIQAATLETLSENLSDGVIAPLFWFAIAGIPGMMTYKMINTLDSMIAYKNERYLYFGRFAARLDDVANWIPARLTAFFMALCSGSSRAFRFILKFGKAHSSPNAGYPEAALAGALNVTFGGPHHYFGQWISKPLIGEEKRNFNKNDLIKTVKIMRRTELIFLLVLTILAAVSIYYSIIL